MSSSFIQLTNARTRAPTARSPPSPTNMTMNSQYENMSTTGRGPTYEPLDVPESSRENNKRLLTRSELMQRSATEGGRAAPAPAQKQRSNATPIRQRYKGFANTLRMRQQKAQKSKEAARKSAPVQPPRVSSLVKSQEPPQLTRTAKTPAPPPKNSPPQKRPPARRTSTSAPSRRVPTPPPTPPPTELETSSQSPTYSVPMRNSMLQSEMPDVIYQVTETSYSPRDEDEYEVPISQRLGSDSSATGTSKSSAGSGYAPIRMKDALTSLQRRVEAEDDAGSVYSCTKAVDARTNAPVTRKPVIDVGIDRDALNVAELDLSKPLVVQPTPALDDVTPAVHAEEEVYANIGPRSKRTSALVANGSDYGALCEHSSARPSERNTLAREKEGSTRSALPQAASALSTSPSSQAAHASAKAFSAGPKSPSRACR